MEKREAMVEESVAPGFRFHPTDEELVWYYLRRKVYGKPISLDAISEIDLYKFEPDFLPGLSKLKSGDRQWYFFSALDRKYVHGMRTNRATAHGYWKTTGKDKPVHHNSRLAGFKKTLVYHFGRPPRGTRTDWVMHEYKLIDPPLHHHHHPYVLCRIFRKSGSGPKNADHYGAPFVEEDWEDTDPDNTVCCDVSFEDPYADDDDDHHHPLQDLVLQSPPANQVENCNPTVPAQSGSQACTDRDFYDLLAQDGSNSDVVRNHNMPQPNDDCNGASVSLPDELCSRAHLNTLDDSALGPNIDNDIDIGEFFNFDCLPEFVGVDADQTDAIEQNQEDTFLHIPSAREQLPRASDDSTGSSSRQVLEDDQSRTVLSKEGLWLENIPAHPAFASEFPTKDMASRLASAAVEASTSIHVTAGMIRITEMPIGAIRSGLELSFDKTGSVNVVLSFELPMTDALPDLSAMFPSKLNAAASRGWLHFLFFWVLFFVVSIGIGTCIYAK